MGALAVVPTALSTISKVSRIPRFSSGVPALGASSKLGTRAGIGTTGILGSLGVGMAIPLIGGVASLMGGALSLAGGVLSAGSTIAGIAGRAAGGVLGAVGGLAGGGQSGAVDNSQTQMVPSFAGEKASTNPGSSLANVKSMLPATIGDGAMSMLPTGEESETTLLTQILGQTRTNTMVLSSILGVLTANLVQTRIEGAKKTKGEEDPKKPGIVKRTFSALGDSLKSMSSSLSNNAKSMLKGVGIVALLLLFRKYRTQISGVVANIFETLEGWYQAFNAGGNPITDMFERVKIYFNDEVLPVLKTILIGVMGMLYTAVATVINAILPFGISIPTKVDFSETFGVVGDAKSSNDSNDSSDKISYSPVGDSKLELMNASGEIKTNYFEMGKDGFPAAMTLDNAIYDIEGGDSEAVQGLIKERLAMMYKNFNNSGGRIQWTGIGKGFTLGEGVNSLFKNSTKLDISRILASQPIVDGYQRTRQDLNNPNLLLLPFDKNSPFRDEFVKSLIDSSTRKQYTVENDSTSLMLSPGDFIAEFERFKLNQNRELQKKLLLQENELKKATSGLTILDGKSTTNYNSKTSTHMQSGVTDTNIDLSWHWGGALNQAQ